MKNVKKFLGFIAIVAIIGFGFASCGGDDVEDECVNCKKIGSTGEGGGVIFYHNHAGFTIIGADSFTAYYLEASPSNQGANITWCTCINLPNCDVSTGTAIGTGKANTAAIIAATHESAITTSNCAAKAADSCTSGGKSDWFLPSKDEFYEMYKLNELKSHLGISSGSFWSSSQYNEGSAWYQKIGWGDSNYGFKNNPYNDTPPSFRAIRAF